VSWFGRKQKNRRLRHNTQVLDVKLRSDQVRASRMRLTAITLTVTFATILGFYIIWRSGEFALNRLIYENNSFAVQQIDVQTDGVISAAQLRLWCGVKRGENLLALDLGRVKRELEMVSIIRSVAVERVLPHTLRLRVMEREPIALIHVVRPHPGGSMEITTLHLDADGCVMALLDPRQRATPVTQTNETLPLVLGINPMELAPGKRLDSAPARLALQLISAFEHSPMSGMVDLESVDISSTQILQLKTTQGSQITFSLVDFDRQLRRWREIYDQGQLRSKVIATLDLSVPNNIPAKWIEANTAPQLIPKTKNLQHYRKKNA
jgi:cell division septal protein FtsQ